MHPRLIASRRRRAASRARWLRRAGALALAATAAAPVPATAAPRHDSTPGHINEAGPGVVYGGVTSQDFGLMIEVNRSGRRITRAAAGIGLTCTSGMGGGVPDGWVKIAIARSGRFDESFMNTSENDDGTTVDVEGSFAGRFSRSRSGASGTWTLKATMRDAAGAVTDTCDSGEVTWRVKR